MLCCVCTTNTASLSKQTQNWLSKETIHIKTDFVQMVELELAADEAKKKKKGGGGGLGWGVVL